MKTLGLNQIVLVLAALGLSACSPNVQFSETLSEGLQESPTATEPDPDESQDDDEVRCQPGQVVVVRPSKVVFVVDQSGSNINGPYGFPGMATDPDKSFRYGVMSEFFQEHGAKQHVSWGFVTFNASSAQGLIHSGNPQQPHFTNNPTSMIGAFADFATATDVGVTPYKAALDMVRGMIERDMQTALPGTQYLVAFITDGHPTDYCPGGPNEVECPGRILDDLLDADVRTLVNVANERIQFSTVYYGLPNTDAAQRLARMASMGGGQFVDTNTSSEIRLNDVLEVTRPICQ